MKAVILCGGKGLRMNDATHYPCKPLIEIGGMPILWHIMKIYKQYAIKEFILCLGYNGSYIKEYFINFRWKNYDFHLKRDWLNSFFMEPEEWDIIFADTGQDTMTGGRIKRIQKYIDEDEFMLTYGDGVSDVPLDQLLAYHREKGKIATITGIRPRSGYGLLNVRNGIAESFHEKPVLEGWINGGFFVLHRNVFDYLDGDRCIWEEEPLKQLAAKSELAVFQHTGFWQSMDTAKDVELLNELWNNNRRPWVSW